MTMSCSAGHLARMLFEDREVLPVGDHHFGLGEVELVLEVLGHVEDDRGDHHRPDLRARVERHQKTGGVRQVGEDELAFGDPPLREPISKAVHLLVKLCVGEDLLPLVLVHEDDEGLVCVLAHLALQQLPDVHVAADDRRVLGIQDVHPPPSVPRPSSQVAQLARALAHFEGTMTGRMTALAAAFPPGKTVPQERQKVPLPHVTPMPDPTALQSRAPGGQLPGFSLFDTALRWC